MNNWASSSRAECFAIFNILLICPQHGNIIIHTDSQATIQTFNALYTPQLTDRRLQKVNNCHIWQAIKQIIDRLQFHVTLNKVKAHSDNFFNDQADALAKQGTRNNLICDINRNGLSCQHDPLIFNKEHVIDRNIRSTLKKPLEYRKLEQHLSHESLHLIRKLSFDELVNWEFTKFWMAFYLLNRPTARQLSKITSWKMKASTLQLPF